MLSQRDQARGEVKVKKISLEVEPGIAHAVTAAVTGEGRRSAPVAVGLCQQGKSTFLKNNALAIAELLKSGVAVCLPDVRGTGEGRSGGSRGRRSEAAALSSTELMLGQTLVGAQVRDLRSVLRYLRGLKGIDGKRIALWGTSFAKINSRERTVAAPLDLDQLPDQSEPLGGLLALFGALYEDSVRAVNVQNGLGGYRLVLQSPFVYLPHDAVVPGALTAGDLCDVAASLAPRPLRIETPVDGLNRRLTADELTNHFGPTARTYASVGSSANLGLFVEPAADTVRWLVDSLKAR